MGLDKETLEEFMDTSVNEEFNQSVQGKMQIPDDEAKSNRDIKPLTVEVGQKVLVHWPLNAPDGTVNTGEGNNRFYAHFINKSKSIRHKTYQEVLDDPEFQQVLKEWEALSEEEKKKKKKPYPKVQLSIYFKVIIDGKSEWRRAYFSASRLSNMIAVYKDKQLNPLGMRTFWYAHPKDTEYTFIVATEHNIKGAGVTTA